MAREYASETRIKNTDLAAEQIGVIYARYCSHFQREESIEQQIEEFTAFAR